MIMKKYIFLIVTVVCLFACKDGDEVRQTTSPEASFSIDKEEYTVGDIVYLMRPFCIRGLEPMLLN